MVKVSVTSVGKSHKSLESKIKILLSKLLGLTKKGDFFVAVYLIDNATMQKLNRIYRGANKATNVLAFPVPKPIWGSPMSRRKKTINIWDIGLRGSRKNLGEIYLAPDYIARTLKGSARKERELKKIAKKSRNKVLENEIAYLLVHGFLHLLGFDHKKKGDTISMQFKEQELLKKLRTLNIEHQTLLRNFGL